MQRWPRLVDLPLRKIRSEEKPPAFAPPEAAAPVKLAEVRQPSNRRELAIDQKTGVQTLTIVDDFGASTIVEHGLIDGAVGREVYRIQPDDPSSAVPPAVARRSGFPAAPAAPGDATSFFGACAR